MSKTNTNAGGHKINKFAYHILVPLKLRSFFCLQIICIIDSQYSGDKYIVVNQLFEKFDVKSHWGDYFFVFL